MSLVAELVRTIEAGTRLIVLQTSEEARAIELLEDVAARADNELHTWSLASGVDAEGSPRGLASVLCTPGPGLWALLDPAPALADPTVARALREAASRVQGPTWIVLEPPSAAPWSIPPEARRVVLPTPDRDAFEGALAEIGLALETRFPGARDVFEESGPSISRALLGLGMPSAERLVAEAVLTEGIDPARLVDFITRHKPSLVPTEGLLEPAHALASTTLGGYDGFKAWMQTRALALLPEAEAAGILPPRGVLLLGVQGCGKSLAARTCADTLGLPVFRLDPGRLFGGTVGRSEANLRQVLASLDAMAPVVLWIDEIDKGFSGATGGRSDAGTSARVMGGLLTWLAERARPVFVVATANDVQGLPPELLRRGRLDEIFFFDLPGASAREDILRIHLEDEPRRRLGSIPPMTGPWPAFASIIAAAEGFSGAEIQASVTEARLHAFAAERPLSPDDLRQAVADTVPLSVTRAESIQALREWAVHRTRPAAM
ncbi:MAG: AAA family ATPase [Nannocystaceae bacterium]|nr:AAA family ATPase [Nannocystaceae bacterium]